MIHLKILPCRLFQNIEQNFLCYTVGPCWLSIIVTGYCVCTFNMRAQRINICGWSTGIFYLRGQVGLKFHPWGWLTKSSELEGNTRQVNQMKHIDHGAQAVKDAEAVTFLCVCVSHSVMSDSSRPHGLQLSRLLCPWDSPGKNNGVGYHFLSQWTFPTQRLNPDLPHCRQILYHQSHQGSPIIFLQEKKKKKETFSLCFFLQGRWSLCLALSVYFVDFPMNTHLCAHKGWWWSESGTSKCSSSVTPNTTCPWNIHVFCFLCEERGFTRHSPALTFRFHLLCWQINHCLVHQLFTQNLFKSMLL